MKKFIILIPLYNDWLSVSKLLERIELQISSWDVEVSVIIVNDASTEERSSLNLNFKKIKSLKILNMKENKVHQRSIAAGLKYICEKEEFDRIMTLTIEEVRRELREQLPRRKQVECNLFKPPVIPSTDGSQAWRYMTHTYIQDWFRGDQWEPGIFVDKNVTSNWFEDKPRKYEKEKYQLYFFLSSHHNPHTLGATHAGSGTGTYFPWSGTSVTPPKILCPQALSLRFSRLHGNTGKSRPPAPPCPQTIWVSARATAQAKTTTM